MEVYYKFKSAKDFDSFPIDSHYTTVSDVKQYIFKKKCSGKRTKFDKLILTNAQTNQVYLDGETLIPVNTSLIVVPVQDASPGTADEDSKIRALIQTPALDWWQCHNTTHSSFGAGRGFGRGGMDGRSGARGFGRGGLLERMTPPSSYICHRCKVPGHFIQHCSTNGNPMFDVKRTKPTTGIPHSMLVASPDGSYALPNGDAAVLKPDEAAFEKEIQGIPSTRSVADLPAELYCPVCRAVMKDAVIASKCCFKSFCDKCIRDYIISNSLCICGATKVLADDLLPNNTMRDTIVRLLESSNCRGDNVSGASQQVTESAPFLQLKIPSSMLSAASKEVELAPKSEGNAKVGVMAEPVEVDNVTPKTLGEANAGNGEEVSEAVDGCARRPGSEMCPQVTDEEMQQNLLSGDLGKKKKKLADMQLRPDKDFAAENYLMPCETSNFGPYWNGMQPKFDGFGRPYGGQMPYMCYGPGPTYIPFWGAFHPVPFGAQASMMPIPPQGDLAEYETGFNGCSGPPITSREESEAPKTTIKQKQDLERTGRNVEVSRVRNSCRDMIYKEDVPSLKSKVMSITPPERSTHDPELIRTSSKRKVKHEYDYYEEHTHQPPKNVCLHHHQSEFGSATRTSIPSNTVDLPPLPSQTSTEKTLSDRKNKASVLARITFPEGESAVFKKRKLNSSSPAVNGSSNQRSNSLTSNKYHEDHRKTAAAVSKYSYEYYADHHDYESSDDDRHFKRRPSRYESSPTPALKEGKHFNRGWGEKGSWQQALVGW